MYGISSMRSYVVKRFSHFRHSRRRRMESASLLSRESTTLSLAKPQKGHFMVFLGTECIVARSIQGSASAISQVMSSELWAVSDQPYPQMGGDRKTLVE